MKKGKNILKGWEKPKARQHNLSENQDIWFGKYKGTKLKDIPNEYFQYLLDNNIAFRGIKNYAKRRLNL